MLTNVKFAPLRYSSFLGLQRLSITLKRRQRAKMIFILALCLLLFDHMTRLNIFSISYVE
ncbi:hypothetical protein C6X98_15790 [Bacillus pumilus]|nr:hypothetical protein C6X98_15790 [Bacillus pumilus]